MTVGPSITSLRDSYAEESARIEAEFATTSDGSRSIRSRTAQVDRIVVELTNGILGADIQKICLAAMGDAPCFPSPTSICCFSAKIPSRSGGIAIPCGTSRKSSGICA
jgi:hypothetical protein